MPQVNANLMGTSSFKFTTQQSVRAKTLFESKTINEVDYEQTVLELANAKAEVVGAQVEVENARIAVALVG